jgi:isoquinoline 1-oxidoreductase beta subunit
VAPAVEVHLVPSTEPPGGMGETGTSGIVPAIGKSIFAATAKRLRRMPIDPAMLKA